MVTTNVATGNRGVATDYANAFTPAAEAIAEIAAAVQTLATAVFADEVDVRDAGQLLNLLDQVARQGSDGW